MLKKLMIYLGRHRVIMDRQADEPYLERYYVFLKDRGTFPFNIFLHKFLKSDPDDLHDHPWRYFTFILRGGYWEYTPTGKHWRGPGHFRVCNSESLHRIEVKPGVHAWSLFIPFSKVREWGFIKENKWIPHYKYLKHPEKL
mgnify:CR=1 FL=1|tara:strand:+ start:276 stop:698 length:423 start_codon:yes stop_codon:yes gene_type:complete